MLRAEVCWKDHHRQDCYRIERLCTIVDMIKQGNRKCAMDGHLVEHQQEDGPMTSHSGGNR